MILWLLAITISLAMVAGCASSPHAARVQADREIAARANVALAAAGLSPRLEVRCHDGVAALLGSAPDPESQEAASVVRTVPGVIRVDNLVLNESSSTASGFARSGKTPILARVGTPTAAERQGENP